MILFGEMCDPEINDATIWFFDWGSHIRLLKGLELPQDDPFGDSDSQSAVKRSKISHPDLLQANF